MTTTPPAQPSSWPTPVEVNLLTSADEHAQELKDETIGAVASAQRAMRFGMLNLARRHLTDALSGLDALEARLTELREKR